MCTLTFAKTRTNRTDVLHQETWAGSLGGSTYTGLITETQKLFMKEDNNSFHFPTALQKEAIRFEKDYFQVKN